ncbi:MAG: cell wall hydrolase [Erythrobacter sp.]|nr:cell wall hydrolase [Erythrobacter sp.]
MTRARILKRNAPDVIKLPDRSRERIDLRPKQAEARFSLRKRLAVLVAAIAVPAMAAPGDFGAEPAAAPITDVQFSGQSGMPFEQPGMSFPGSAFYYLADPPTQNLIALPTTDPLETSADAAGHEVGQVIDTGPAANGFLLAGNGVSKARAQQCLAQAVWYEAASESDAGQRAVAQVVLNRVAHPNWPSSICGVVYQGSNRSTGCQFSFTCDGSLRRKAGGASWARAQRVAAAALAGEVYAPVGHATHYHTLWVNPYWAGSLEHVGTIGAHRFYRNRGSAGRKDAFTGNYAGFEPSVRGSTARSSPRNASQAASLAPPQTVANDAVIARSRSIDPAASGAEIAAANPAVGSPVADPALREAGQVRANYANAGKWKIDPGTLDLSREAPASEAP